MSEAADRRRPVSTEGGVGILHLDVEQDWLLGEITSFFGTLRYAYASMNLFLGPEGLNHQLPDPLLEWSIERFPYRYLGFSRYGASVPNSGGQRSLDDYFRDLRDYVLFRTSVYDDLALVGIHITSPGWIEVIGQLNPLTFISQMVVTIRDWKTSRERGNLENREKRIQMTIMENEIIRERVSLMKENNFDEQEIQEYIRTYVYRPVDELTQYQLIGRVSDARVAALPPGETSIESPIT